MSTAEYRIAFKAGRMFRRSPTSKFVDPDARKGAIILQNGDDGLLHFIWKNRSTNESEEVRVFAVAYCWYSARERVKGRRSADTA